jgi:hypothetical protein
MAFETDLREKGPFFLKVFVETGKGSRQTGKGYVETGKGSRQTGKD